MIDFWNSDLTGHPSTTLGMPESCQETVEQSGQVEAVSPAPTLVPSVPFCTVGIQHNSGQLLLQKGESQWISSPTPQQSVPTLVCGMSYHSRLGNTTFISLLAK